MKNHRTIRFGKTAKRVAPWIRTFALTVSLLSGIGIIIPKDAQAAVTLHNPAYNADTDTAKWDCVWFGNYWQNDTNGDGKADKNDVKEPIKWRVLSVDGDDVFLLADKNLEVKPYNAKYGPVTWETCTMRSWLNGYDSSKNAYGADYTHDNFIDNAFSTAEQTAIKNTDVVNEDNPYYDTKGGNNTIDKIYLLSIAEVSNAAYGFNSKYEAESSTRFAMNTAYVSDYGDGDVMFPVGKAESWWLRSPGAGRRVAAAVRHYGYGASDYVGDVGNGIRPALHLTLSTSTSFSYAGTVCSDGKVKEQPGKGQIVKNAATNAYYQIVSTGDASGTVSYFRTDNKNKKVKIPASITYAKKKYKVTALAENAFAGNKKLKTVVIGKNIKSIQKRAFFKCKALSEVTVKSKVLEKVGKNAFKGTSKKLKVTLPKSLSKAEKKKCKKLFQGKGNKKVRVR